MTETVAEKVVNMVLAAQGQGGPHAAVAAAIDEYVEAAKAEQREVDLAMHLAYRPEVVAEVAVHLGSHEDWEEIARWCGGRIESSQDPSGEYNSVIVLPNGEAGGEWAWLMLGHDGEFHFRAGVEAPASTATADGREAALRNLGFEKRYRLVGHPAYPDPLDIWPPTAERAAEIHDHYCTQTFDQYIASIGHVPRRLLGGPLRPEDFDPHVVVEWKHVGFRERFAPTTATVGTPDDTGAPVSEGATS